MLHEHGNARGLSGRQPHLRLGCSLAVANFHLRDIFHPIHQTHHFLAFFRGLVLLALNLGGRRRF